MRFQHGDFIGRNGAAAANDNADMLGTLLTQHVDHVLEVFVVAALVSRAGDAIRVFLNGRTNDFRYRAVVPKVDHFRTVLLQQAANDVDCRVVAVEQGSCADEPQGRGLDTVSGSILGGGGHRHGATHKFDGQQIRWARGQKALVEK